MRKREANEFDVLEVDMGYVTPCHIPLTWRGVPFGLDQDGYTSMLVTLDGLRVRVRAHRLRYEALHGPLEAGLVPDHLCKHRPCCNAAHLEAVTIAVNNRRGFRTKLTAEKVVEIQALYAGGGITHAQIAARFDMSQSHITNIINGKYWADGLSPAWERVKARRSKKA